MTEPLVTVITPTYQQHELLMNRCVPSVFGQSYPHIEHIIVSDEPDRDLAYKVSQDLWRRPLHGNVTRPLHFAQLPRIDRTDGLVDYGSRARNRGLELASGEFIAYLDDDNAWRPLHLATLVSAITESGSDFAYSQLIRHGGKYEGEVIGGPPAHGQIDTSLIMHRAGLPQMWGMWPLPEELDGDKHAPDWGFIERLLKCGATWTFVPQITVDYYMQDA